MKEIPRFEVKGKIQRFLKERVLMNDPLTNFFVVGSVINIGVIVGVLTKEIIEKKL